jgi:lipopolysaccharide transport system ATP-binding protein
MDQDIAIQASGLGKLYRIESSHRSTTLREALTSGTIATLRSARQKLLHGSEELTELWAVRDVSFDVSRGETVALIGPNGSGKSTLLKIIARIVSPTTGFARIRGRVGALLEVGTGFHPELTGRENIYLNGAILGMTAQDIRKRFDEIVEFSGVEEFLAVPIKRYSSGMVMRLAFAVAAHLEPEVLIIDEVLAVGDAAFQQKCLGRMDEVSKSGCTVFFVSHNLAAVQRLCSRALLLEKGRLIADGATSDVIGQYLENACLQTAPDEWLELPPREQRARGPVVTAVRYGDPGRSSSAPRSLGPVRIEARIEAPHRIQAMLAADIRDELGNKLINADSWTKANHHIDVPAGISVWRFDIESLHLEAGRYVIDLWLANMRSSTLDYRPMAVQMNVLKADGLPADPGDPPQHHGLVPCRFDLYRADDVDEPRRAI